MEQRPPYDEGSGTEPPSVLCVDDDRDVAEVVQAILADEGYRISCLYELADDALLRTVGKLEPDVILLDSAQAIDYGESWDLAGVIHGRPRPVSVLMFTANPHDIAEAEEASTSRAVQAGFAGVVPKPFHIDELLTAVAKAAGRSQPFDRSRAGEERRTRDLVAALEARGATEINPSTMREWAIFRDQRGTLVQVYWWQQRGVYQVGRYSDAGQMTMMGQFVDRDAAIEVALPS